MYLYEHHFQGSVLVIYAEAVAGAIDCATPGLRYFLGGVPR